MAEKDQSADNAVKYKTWLPVREAVQLLSHLDHRTARLQIYNRLQYGYLESMARRYTYKNNTAEYGPISKDVWKNADKGISTSELWVTGDITVYLSDYPLFLSGVRLEPSGFQELIPVDRAPNAPAPTPQTAPSSAPANKGGRPAKVWWDDLWVEMTRQLFVGDLQPKRQADIEKAMLDWVFAQGDEIGVATIRPAARKLWNAIQRPEDKN